MPPEHRPPVAASPGPGGCRDPVARAALEAFWKEAGFSADQVERLRFQSRRFDAVLRACRTEGLGKDWNVLDVGAGPGALSVALASVLGGRYELSDYVEPTPRLREALTRHGIGNFVRCDLSARDPFAGIQGGRDLVLFVEVLEHLLVNPVPLLRRLGGLLRPGARLLLTTPNQGRLHNRLRLAGGHAIREGNAFPDDDQPTFGHVQEYTVDEMLGLVRRAGLEPSAWEVVQNLPSMSPTGRQRLGHRLLNGGISRRMRLGDEMLIVARRSR